MVRSVPVLFVAFSSLALATCGPEPVSSPPGNHVADPAAAPVEPRRRVDTAPPAPGPGDDLAVLTTLFPDADPAALDPYRTASGVTAALGPDAADVLARALRDRADDATIVRALLALAALREAALPALPDVVALLTSDDDDVVSAAAAAIGAMGAGAASAVPALDRVLSATSDGDVCRQVLFALTWLGRDGAALLADRATTEDYELQDVAQRAFEDVAPDVSAEFVTAMLGSDDSYVRCVAVEVIAEQGADAAPRVPALLGLLDDPDIGSDALESLRQLGVVAAAAASELVRRVELPPDDSDPLGRGDVIRALASVGRHEPAAVRLLARIAGSDDDNATTAADELRGLDVDARPAAAEIARGVAGDTSVAIPLMSAILAVGPDAAAALPAVRKWLDHENVDVRTAALRAVAGLGPAAADALPRVRELLTDEEPRVQLLAALAVYCITGDVGPAREEVALYLRHKSWYPRSWAAEIPGMMGPGGAALVPEIRAFLFDPEVDLEYAVGPLVVSLGTIGAPAASALPELRALLADPRHAAFTDDLVVAMTSIGVPVDEAVALWSRLLRDHDPEDRLRAVRALADLGPAARPALPLLEPMRHDPDRHVRAAVAEALPRIR